MKKMIIAAAAASLASTAALADVVWTSDATSGFVGKGDVQVALGLDDKQLQAQASSLKNEFTFHANTSYEIDCMNVTGNPAQPARQKIKREEFNRIAHVSASVAAETRLSKSGSGKVTGFNMGAAGPLSAYTPSCPSGWEIDPTGTVEELEDFGFELKIRGENLIAYSGL